MVLRVGGKPYPGVGGRPYPGGGREAIPRVVGIPRVVRKREDPRFKPVFTLGLEP